MDWPMTIEPSSWWRRLSSFFWFAISSPNSWAGMTKKWGFVKLGRWPRLTVQHSSKCSLLITFQRIFANIVLSSFSTFTTFSFQFYVSLPHVLKRTSLHHVVTSILVWLQQWYSWVLTAVCPLVNSDPCFAGSSAKENRISISAWSIWFFRLAF